MDQPRPAFAQLSSATALPGLPSSKDIEAAMNLLLRIGHAAMPELKATRDGRLVLLRGVDDIDEDQLDQFFRGLSPTSRRLRFHAGVSSVPRHLLQRMTRWDPLRELALLAVPIGADPASVVGEARYVVGDGSPGEREFALAIDDRWQGSGLGSAMLCRLTRHARARGVERLVADVMPENAAMVALARRQGFSVRRHPADPRLLQLELAMGQGSTPYETFSACLVNS